MRPSISFERDPVLLKARQQSNFRALKSLVEAENNIRVAHNRIKVLEMNEEKNQKRLNNQLGLIKKIEKVRETSNERYQYLASVKTKLTEENELNRSRFSQLNEEHKVKIKQTYESMEKEKKRNYLTMQEQREQAERKINQEKARDLRQKERNHAKLMTEEELAKNNLLDFIDTKQNKIKEIKKVEIINIRCKERQKNKQLKDLSNIEMKLIHKQSQSKMNYFEVKNKLDSLLNNVKLNNSISKKDLKTSIHLRGQQNH